MRPGLRKDLRFYVQFSDRHKYSDGTASGEAARFSRELRFLDKTKPLEGGMDFGNMLSMVIGQPDGAKYRVHKNFYEIPPRWFRELADQFLDFFKFHECRVLDLYYDRAGNNYQRQGEDHAGKIKDAIERDAAGHRTGWVVNLMSRHQATIKQAAEYSFMQELMGGDNKALPALLVDVVNCREMVSSIEGAKAEVKYRANVKVVAKVKRSEKLEPKKLPMFSTNFSDAFKYLIMRRKWLQAMRGTPHVQPDSFVDRWMEQRK